MAVETNIYDDTFFKNTQKFENDSAQKFVDIICRYFSFSSVIDVGCGIGIYLKEFERLGKEIFGFDGAPAALTNSLIGNKIKIHDLTTPLLLNRTFDLCLCMEVAEHLPKEAAEILVDSLTRLSSTIIFTAATPGQGSREIGHVNEQPHQYWIDLFRKKGYVYEEKMSLRIRSELKENEVIWWIVNNFMVFRKRDKINT